MMGFVGIRKVKERAICWKDWSMYCSKPKNQLSFSVLNSRLEGVKVIKNDWNSEFRNFGNTKTGLKEQVDSFNYTED